MTYSFTVSLKDDLYIYVVHSRPNLSFSTGTALATSDHVLEAGLGLISVIPSTASRSMEQDCRVLHPSHFESKSDMTIYKTLGIISVRDYLLNVKVCFTYYMAIW